MNVFRTVSHTCNICMLEQPGDAFSEVNSCGHAYCNMCLREMWYRSVVKRVFYGAVKPT